MFVRRHRHTEVFAPRRRFWPTGKLMHALGMHLNIARDRTGRYPHLWSLVKPEMEGTCGKLLRKLATLDLLVLEDVGLGTITLTQRHDLLELLEDRYNLRSTVVSSQRPAGEVAHLDRRPHSRRRDSRPFRPQRVEDRVKGDGCGPSRSRLGGHS